MAPLTDNPNASQKYGKTQIETAKHEEIRMISQSFIVHTVHTIQNLQQYP